MRACDPALGILGFECAGVSDMDESKMTAMEIALARGYAANAELNLEMIREFELVDSEILKKFRDGDLDASEAT